MVVYVSWIHLYQMKVNERFQYNPPQTTEQYRPAQLTAQQSGSDKSAGGQGVNQNPKHFYSKFNHLFLFK